MPKPYPQEFREGCLHNWMKKADVEDGKRPGLTAAGRVELRDAKRIRLLEQEDEVLRRAAADLSQANLPGK